MENEWRGEELSNSVCSADNQSGGEGKTAAALNKSIIKPLHLCATAGD